MCTLLSEAELKEPGDPKADPQGGLSTEWVNWTFFLLGRLPLIMWAPGLKFPIISHCLHCPEGVWVVPCWLEDAILEFGVWESLAHSQSQSSMATNGVQLYMQELLLITKIRIHFWNILAQGQIDPCSILVSHSVRNDEQFTSSLSLKACYIRKKFGQCFPYLWVRNWHFPIPFTCAASKMQPHDCDWGDWDIPLLLLSVAGPF